MAGDRRPSAKIEVVPAGFQVHGGDDRAFDALVIRGVAPQCAAQVDGVLLAPDTGAGDLQR